MNNIEVIAKAAHEMNRAYCVFLGDRSQVNWEDTSEDLKDSTRVGVRFHLDNPEATPEQSHMQWQIFKAAEGWVLGKTKDAEKKTHPCMKDYSKLPKDQRVKDVLFKETVRNMHEVLTSIPVVPTAPTVPPKIPVVPKPSEAPRTSPEPRRQKGFVKRPDTVVKAPTSNTKGSGGSLRGKPVKPMATPVLPRESVGTPERTGGLIKSGAGDGAAALAMFDN